MLNYIFILALQIISPSFSSSGRSQIIEIQHITKKQHLLSTSYQLVIFANEHSHQMAQSNIFFKNI